MPASDEERKSQSELGGRQFVQTVRGTLRRFAVSFLGMTLPALILTAVASEAIFRVLLFSKVGFMEKFRIPELYFDYDSESNYWKLYYLFDGKLKPPANPHPLLGWVGDFSRKPIFITKLQY
jgi:hypothetical protein